MVRKGETIGKSGDLVTENREASQVEEADLEICAEKVTLSEEKGAASLSAKIDSKDGGKTTALTCEGTELLSKVVEDGCYVGELQRKQLLIPISSEKGGFASVQRTRQDFAQSEKASLEFSPLWKSNLATHDDLKRSNRVQTSGKMGLHWAQTTKESNQDFMASGLALEDNGPLFSGMGLNRAQQKLIQGATGPSIMGRLVGFGRLHKMGSNHQKRSWA